MSKEGMTGSPTSGINVCDSQDVFGRRNKIRLGQR